MRHDQVNQEKASGVGTTTGGQSCHQQTGSVSECDRREAALKKMNELLDAAHEAAPMPKPHILSIRYDAFTDLLTPEQWPAFVSWVDRNHVLIEHLRGQLTAGGYVQ